MMKEQLNAICNTHGKDCVDIIVDQHTNGERGIPIHDGGGSHVKIDYCPWCGVNLNGKQAQT